MIDQSWYERPEGMRLSVSSGGVVCRLMNDIVQIALTREHNSTQFVLPKGHLEAGESPEVTARREIAEEAGARDLHLLGDLGVLERLSFNKDAWKKIHYFLFATRHIELTPTDLKHAHGAAWFPLHDPPPMLWPEQANLLRLRQEYIVTEVNRWATVNAPGQV